MHIYRELFSVQIDVEKFMTKTFGDIFKEVWGKWLWKMWGLVLSPSLTPTMTRLPPHLHTHHNQTPLIAPLTSPATSCYFVQFINWWWWLWLVCILCQFKWHHFDILTTSSCLYWWSRLRLRCSVAADPINLFLASNQFQPFPSIWVWSGKFHGFERQPHKLITCTTTFSFQISW